MDLDMFLKGTELEGKETELCASSKFRDEQGKIIPWKIRQLSVDEVEKIRKSCFYRGERGIELDPLLFNRRLCAESIIEPNLRNAALQDSYGVKRPEELITRLFDNVGEYDRLVRFVAELNGLGKMSERIEEAKN